MTASIPVDQFFENSDAALEDSLSGTGILDDYRQGPDAAAMGPDDTAPMPGGGPLLEEPDPKKVFSAIDKIVLRQRRVAQNRDESRKHWDRVRSGVQFSQLEKSEDRSVWKAVLPPGIEDIQSPVPNKIDDLCNKIISQLLADPPLPNPKPDSDSDRDRGAADLAKKFLRSDGTPAGTNDMALFRSALQLNTTASSAFAFSWIDRTGGGWRPKQIMAHPQAMDPKNPLMGPKLDPATGEPVMDPTTMQLDAAGQPIPGTGQPVMERTAAPVLRYVGEVDDPKAAAVGITAKKQVFVKNATEAARQWLPKHRTKLLPPAQVRTVPVTATVANADAIILIMFETLGEAKRRFRVLQTMKPAAVQTLTTWRPKNWRAIVPEALRAKIGDMENPASATDDTLLFWYHKFCRIKGDYPDGAEIAVNGANGGTILVRDTLREDVELDDGRQVPVLMDPPIAQFLGEEDMEGGDPFGAPPIATFSGGNETFARLWLSVLESLNRQLSPNVFLPANSTVSREDLTRRDGTPIDILTAEDKPTFEQVPALPSYLPTIMERLETTLNSQAGLSETANVLDSPYAVSGKAKEISIKQARMAIAQRYQNLINGVVTFWRHKLQLAQARLTVPQQVKLTGIESAYKQPWFTGADMVGINDMAVEPGSASMMQPMEKAQWFQVLQQNEWIDNVQAGEIVRASLTDDLGLPPNIHEEKINREIAEWAEGAPPGWLEAYAANKQKEQQYQTEVATAIQQQVAALVAQGFDEQTATAQAQAAVQQQVPPPQMAPLSNPFAASPADEDKQVAAIQYHRLLRFLATVEYTKHEAPWRTLIDAKTTAARQKAGFTTVQEDQLAQQAAAEAQQQAAQAAEQAKAADAERQQRFEAEQNALDRGRAAADKSKQAQSKTDQRTLRAASAQTSAGGTPA